MLYSYKAWKQYIISHQYKVNPFQSTTAQLDGNGKVINKKENDLSITVDINRPLILKVRYV